MKIMIPDHINNAYTPDLRHTDIRVIVADTRADLEAGLGRECFHYLGPPEQLTEPVNMTCQQPTSGMFVQIIQGLKGQCLTLCEVDFVPHVVKQPASQTEFVYKPSF